jgi:hypothetical protein
MQTCIFSKAREVVLDLLIAGGKCVLVGLAGCLWLSVSGLSSRMDTFEKAVCSLSLGVVFAVFAGSISFLVGFEHVTLITIFMVLVLSGLFMIRQAFSDSTPRLNRATRSTQSPTGRSP